MAWLGTLGGQALVVVAAILGAGGGFRFFIEPFLSRRRLRKIVATGVWLSCYELRKQLEAIRQKLAEGGPSAEQMRDSLLKIPSNDFHGQSDWFFKTGYFTMITAYKIAAFSSWMRIYQMSILRATLTLGSRDLASELFSKFDAYKIAASQNTVLWYSYIDAIGERIISASGESMAPLNFSEYCRAYYRQRISAFL